MSADHLLQGLRSPDTDRRALAFETTILEALDVGPEEVDELAEAYRYLSEALLGRGGGVASGDFEPPAKAQFARPHMLAVWGLIYGWRTFEMARRLMGEFRPQVGLAVEIGSGWGPYSLFAALNGFSVRLIEISEVATQMSHRIWSHLDLPAPEVVHRPASHSDGRDASLIALPYSMWEIRDIEAEPAKHAHWLDRWGGPTNEGVQVHVLEAGTREASQGLQSVRDVFGVRKMVSGPCCGVAACPRLAEGDWCHFTWRNRPGPLTRQVADIAKRRWQELHSSWLVLGAPPERSGALRVLEVRSRGKAKSQVELCGPNGLVRLTGLLRDRAVAERFEALQPGSMVELDETQVTEKGDGLRLMTAEGLRLRGSEPS